MGQLNKDERDKLDEIGLRILGNRITTMDPLLDQTYDTEHFRFYYTSLKNFLLMFFSYRFLRKAQNQNSIAAYIRYKLNKSLKTIFTIIFIITDFLFSPKILLKIIFTAAKLGGETQLAHISKISNKL